MRNLFIGRKQELRILHEALDSEEAEMVAVIGRRRIGKTFLINEAYKGKIQFEITGIQNAPRAEQIHNFVYQLNEASQAVDPVASPSTWLETFILLINWLKQLDQSEKLVVFFDELSWLATPNSGFLRALEFFWNSWAVKQQIVVVICGSAASWMIQKVVNHKGGLHNRISRRIFLAPFSLAETEEYLHSRNLHFDRYQIAELYMTMGGIPHYLKEVQSGQSVVQNIDRICFSPVGLLKEEFSRLYPSLFTKADNHITVIRALGSSHQGLIRKSIVQLSGLAEGGGVSRILEELEQSGFITSYFSFGKKKKEKLFRLTDEYSLFYLRFIKNKRKEGKHTWQHLSQTQAYKSWRGYAFESLWLKHIPQIKQALGIAGVYSETSSFYKKGTTEEEGVQIDLLIDRNDRVINVCEIKFSDSGYVVSKDYGKRLKEKLRIFRESTKTKKFLMLTLLTTFGLKHNEHSLGYVEKVLTLDALFD